jgi:hypothetical protein
MKKNEENNILCASGSHRGPVSGSAALLVCIQRRPKSPKLALTNLWLTCRNTASSITVSGFFLCLKLLGHVEIHNFGVLPSINHYGPEFFAF